MEDAVQRKWECKLQMHTITDVYIKNSMWAFPQHMQLLTAERKNNMGDIIFLIIES